MEWIIITLLVIICIYFWRMKQRFKTNYEKELLMKEIQYVTLIALAYGIEQNKVTITEKSYQEAKDIMLAIVAQRRTPLHLIPYVELSFKELRHYVNSPEFNEIKVLSTIEKEFTRNTPTTYPQ